MREYGEADNRRSMSRTKKISTGPVARTARTVKGDASDDEPRGPSRHPNSPQPPKRENAPRQVRYLPRDLSLLQGLEGRRSVQGMRGANDPRVSNIAIRIPTGVIVEKGRASPCVMPSVMPASSHNPAKISPSEPTRSRKRVWHVMDLARACQSAYVLLSRGSGVRIPPGAPLTFPPEIVDAGNRLRRESRETS